MFLKMAADEARARGGKALTVFGDRLRAEIAAMTPQERASPAWVIGTDFVSPGTPNASAIVRWNPDFYRAGKVAGRGANDPHPLPERQGGKGVATSADVPRVRLGRAQATAGRNSIKKRVRDRGPSRLPDRRNASSFQVRSQGIRSILMLSV